MTNQKTIEFPDLNLTFADFFCGCGGLSLGLMLDCQNEIPINLKDDNT